MVLIMKTATSALVALLACTVLAHPGDDHSAEIAYRQGYHKQPRRSLAQCSEILKARAVEQRANARRAALAESLRQKRGLDHATYMKRDLDSVLDTSHESNDTSINLSTAESILFSGNSSCVLVPEVTQGPYYVEGELIRKNVTETQEGVPLTLDVQVIDVSTCSPVSNVYIDFWHCNATGVYSGIIAQGNGNSDDTTNLDKTFLRGIQPTDSDGVAQFQTIFPGHYTGRATHIHVLSHLNGTVLANGTYAGGAIAHVGQLFFDQDLISEVEATAPYSTNTQDVTENADDSILAQEVETDGVDPMVEYVLLGDDVSEGIFGWVAMGVDSSSNYSVTPAAYYYATGGVENEDSGEGMGGGSGAPNGTSFGGNSTTNGTVTGSGNFTLGSATASASAGATSSSTTASSGGILGRTVRGVELVVSGLTALVFAL